MRARAALAVVGVTAIAGGATGLSGAAFTGERVEPDATVTGGRLDLTLAQEGQSVLDGAFMRPGQTRTEIRELRNAGTVPAGSVAVAVADHVDTPPEAGLGAVLEVTLDDCGTDARCAAPTIAYAGAMKDFAAAQLGGIAAGGSRFVRLTVAWGATKNDPSRQGAATTATIVWTAVAGASA